MIFGDYYQITNCINGDLSRWEHQGELPPPDENCPRWCSTRAYAQECHELHKILTHRRSLGEIIIAEHVYSHTHIEGNGQADHIANNYAKTKQPKQWRTNALEHPKLQQIFSDTPWLPTNIYEPLLTQYKNMDGITFPIIAVPQQEASDIHRIRNIELHVHRPTTQDPFGLYTVRRSDGSFDITDTKNYAQAAGLLPNDVIMHINHTNTEGITHHELITQFQTTTHLSLDILRHETTQNPQTLNWHATKTQPIPHQPSAAEVEAGQDEQLEQYCNSLIHQTTTRIKIRTNRFKAIAKQQQRKRQTQSTHQPQTIHDDLICLIEPRGNDILGPHGPWCFHQHHKQHKPQPPAPTKQRNPFTPNPHRYLCPQQNQTYEAHQIPYHLPPLILFCSAGQIRTKPRSHPTARTYRYTSPKPKT